MNPSNTHFALALAAIIGLAPSAHAGVPDANASTWPRHMVLVGADANNVPDPIGRVDFVIRRFGGSLQGGSRIILDFSAASDLNVAVDQHDAGVRVFCQTGAGPFVEAITDNFGHIAFSIMGHANHQAAGTSVPSVAVSVDGVPFGTIPVAAFDEDGNGLGPADHSLWQSDYFSDQYWERSDFDGDGVLGPADLSAWLTAFFAAGSLFNGPGTSCP